MLTASARFSSLSQETYCKGTRSHPIPDGRHVEKKKKKRYTTESMRSQSSWLFAKDSATISCSCLVVFIGGKCHPVQ